VLRPISFQTRGSVLVGENYNDNKDISQTADGRLTQQSFRDEHKCEN